MILDLHVTGISQEAGVFWAVVYGHDLCALSQKATALNSPKMAEIGKSL